MRGKMKDTYFLPELNGCHEFNLLRLSLSLSLSLSLLNIHPHSLSQNNEIEVTRKIKKLSERMKCINEINKDNFETEKI